MGGRGWWTIISGKLSKLDFFLKILNLCISLHRFQKKERKKSTKSSKFKNWGENLRNLQSWKCDLFGRIVVSYVDITGITAKFWKERAWGDGNQLRHAKNNRYATQFLKQNSFYVYIKDQVLQYSPDKHKLQNQNW